MSATELQRGPQSEAPPVVNDATREKAAKHRGTAYGSPFNLRYLPLWDKIALAALTFMAAVLSLCNLDGAPSYQDYEGTYTAQAFAVHSGSLAPYTYWYDHPPLGWIQIAALNWLPDLLNLGDGTSIGATRHVISVYF